MQSTSVSIWFNPSELVRNQYQQILTVKAHSHDGKIFVAEEPEPYTPEELERIDQTNVVKFSPRY